MLMILGECRSNYRTAEFMYNECYSNHPRKSRCILWFEKQISPVLTQKT